jgi:hypothetical protein
MTTPLGGIQPLQLWLLAEGSVEADVEKVSLKVRLAFQALTTPGTTATA